MASNENYILDSKSSLLTSFTGKDIHEILQYIQSSYESLNDRIKTIRKTITLNKDNWNNNTYILDNALNEAEYGDFFDSNDFDVIISPSEEIVDNVSYREIYNDYEIYCVSQDENGKLNFICSATPDKDIKIHILYMYKPKILWYISEFTIDEEASE